MIELNKIHNEDCLIGMQRIPDKSIDAIICDLPYGTTACKWDSIIPFEPLWEQYNRIIKDNGAIVLFGSQPFTSMVVQSNIKNFKYEWIWEKNRGSNFASLKYQPFKEHESILIFSKKTHRYYPIMQKRSEDGIKRCKYSFNTKIDAKVFNMKYDDSVDRRNLNIKSRNPSSIQKFNTQVGLHPTQKPVALIEYLIKTYTNEGETVLDNCMGSGTTAIACLNTNRNFIGFEMDKGYFDIANERIEKHIIELKQKLF